MSLKSLCGFMKYVLSMSVNWKSELSLFNSSTLGIHLDMFENEGI
jgi:hypothetical protein